MINFIKKFLIGTIGSLSISAGNLLLSVLILFFQTSYEFGQFSFFLIMSSFSCSVINALIGSPLTILINKDSERQENHLYYFPIAFIITIVSSIIIFFTFKYSSNENGLCLYYALASSGIIKRWSGRIICHSNRMPKSVMWSDLTYFLSILIASTLLYATNSMKLLLLLLFCGSIMSELFLGKVYLKWFFKSVTKFHFFSYIPQFKKYGKWSFIGVISTEITANFHAYFITFYFGSIIYAPIAAAMLFFRPSMVVLNSLTQMEKPSFSKIIKEKSASKYKNKIISFSAMLAISILANFLLIYIIIYFNPNFIFRSFSFNELKYPLLIMSFIVVIRVIRGVYSTIIQADGGFKYLSKIYIKASIISIVFVVVYSMYISSTGAILAILQAEFISLILLRNLLKRYESLWIK